MSGDDLGGSDALDSNRTLVTINCSGGGAYNIESQFYVVTKGDIAHARPVRFDTVDDNTGKLKPDDATGLTNAAFDPATGRISSFDWARGLSDCGEASDYGWNGTRFQLLSYRRMGGCKGVQSSQWPIYWNSQVDNK